MRAAHLRPCSLSRYTSAFFLAFFFTLINIATACATEEGQAPPARHNISKGSAYLTQEEQHWLATHDKLTVRIMSSWPPMNFTSPRGEPVGIGVDILRLFEKWSGITLQIEAGPFSDNLEAVKNRKVAALMDVTPKPARKNTSISLVPISRYRTLLLVELMVLTIIARKTWQEKLLPLKRDSTIFYTSKRIIQRYALQNTRIPKRVFWQWLKNLQMPMPVIRLWPILS